ncbi:F-box/kelch-repeat protein At5g43190 [Henckelia pumila]|uniref:F-box/kelch-repeat protein At5g43190 n=1 Tax=Henckelia pumila TaxID=405737 RepID=UPI003C6E9A50
MDSRIWSQLPNHLLERILSFLPLKTFLDLRSTCKHFNSLLFTPRFISKHSLSASSLSSFIILSHPQSIKKCSLFNTGNNSWCEESLSLPRILSSSISSNLLSSSNGLLCFSSPRSSCFLVYNLLPKSSRRVNFPTCMFDDESVTLVSADNGFKLFVLSSAGSSNQALVYSSTAGSWRCFEGISTPVLSESCLQKGVFYDGCLFFTTLEPFHVVCFHLESGRWEGSTVGLPRDDLTFIRVASDGYQKLYLVGGVGTSGISRSIKIWELGKDDQGGDYWVEVETVPEMVCRKFVSVCYHNYEHVYSFWHQGLICLCCYTWPEMLYYKVGRGTWHWLPKCPSLPEKWSCGFKWFSFKPQLYAIV